MDGPEPPDGSGLVEVDRPGRVTGPSYIARRVFFARFCPVDALGVVKQRNLSQFFMNLTAYIRARDTTPVSTVLPDECRRR